MNTAAASASSRRAYRVNPFCEAYGIGRSTAYQEIAAGRLKVTKVGAVTLIAVEDAEAWFNAHRQRKAA